MIGANNFLSAPPSFALAGMLSRDSEEYFEDDIEEVGEASGQGAGENCNEVAAACKEEEQGVDKEELQKRADNNEEEKKGDLQSPSQLEKDVQRLRDNVT